MDAKIKAGIAAAIIVAVVASTAALDNRQLFKNAGSSDGAAASNVLRVGYFPNINHAPAVIGFGNGDFQQALEGIEVETVIFNAGPAAIEALFAGEIDVAYVGPNPAINGYLQSKGDALRVISGVSSGGVVFVVRNDAGINSPEDFAGKKVSSPQLGNTQDVALRKYLKEHGYDVRLAGGGDVQVLPAKPADILTLMIKKEIDGAWVPEPWGARLVKEANARIFLDERNLWAEGRFATSLIVCRTDYLENNRETVKRLLEAHVDKTLWINANKNDGNDDDDDSNNNNRTGIMAVIDAFNAEIEEILHMSFPADELRQALSRIEFTYDPIKESVVKVANDAYETGLLRSSSNSGNEPPDISGMFDLEILNEVLREKGLETIQ